MSCAGCGTSTGLPRGCKSNGHCMTGGCNKLSTLDWLADMPVAAASNCPYVEVSFKNGSRKEFYNRNKVQAETGDLVCVDTGAGYHIGRISLSGELVKIQMRKKRIRSPKEIRNVLRKPVEEEIKKWQEAIALEEETMLKSRVFAKDLKLEMKVGDVEYQADKRKATFYYIADQRVDFRELIKVYGQEFKVRIEMRQIGARQEAGKIGGIGSCGRELCCSTWLTDFRSVTTSAARYQNLSINQSKLSGQCGRLKCCLNFELDTYLDALQDIPKRVDRLQTEKGVVHLQKTDILKRMMWYCYEDSNTFIPLTTQQVIEIQEMNTEGKKPADLAYLVQEPEVEETDFTDVVGQVSLQSLERKDKKRGRGRGKGNRNRTQGRKPDGPNAKKESGSNKRSSQNRNKPRRGGKGRAGGSGPKPAKD